MDVKLEKTAQWKWQRRMKIFVVSNETRKLFQMDRGKRKEKQKIITVQNSLSFVTICCRLYG